MKNHPRNNPAPAPIVPVSIPAVNLDLVFKAKKRLQAALDDQRPRLRSWAGPVKLTGGNIFLTPPACLEPLTADDLYEYARRVVKSTIHFLLPRTGGGAYVRLYGLYAGNWNTHRQLVNRDWIAKGTLPDGADIVQTIVCKLLDIIAYATAHGSPVVSRLDLSKLMQSPAGEYIPDESKRKYSKGKRKGEAIPFRQILRREADGFINGQRRTIKKDEQERPLDEMPRLHSVPANVGDVERRMMIKGFARQLTGVEKAVVGCLLHGLTQAQTGVKLNVSLRTVKRVIARVRKSWAIYSTRSCFGIKPAPGPARVSIEMPASNPDIYAGATVNNAPVPVERVDGLHHIAYDKPQKFWDIVAALRDAIARYEARYDKRHYDKFPRRTVFHDFYEDMMNTTYGEYEL